MPHLLENKRRHKFVAWSLFGLDSHFVLNEAHACSSMDFSHIRNNDRQIYFAYGVLGLKNVETQLHKKISKLPSNKTSTRNIFRFYSTCGQNSKTRLKEWTSTMSSDRGFCHMTKNKTRNLTNCEAHHCKRNSFKKQQQRPFLDVTNVGIVTYLIHFLMHEKWQKALKVYEYLQKFFI